MHKIILVTGGARSGKSSFAENLLNNEQKVLYIATAIPFDDEMKRRIALHKKQRSSDWDTVEVYKNFKQEIAHDLSAYNAILLDCITIMVSNLMLEAEVPDWNTAGDPVIEKVERKIEHEVRDLLDLLGSYNGTGVLVTNELGMGIVPDNPLGRHFRDIAGRTNQAIGRKADEVYLLVSGIPVKIKG